MNGNILSKSSARGTLVYLAASLFSPFERDRNFQIAKALEDNGCDVFVPQTVTAPKTSEGLINLEPVYSKCRGIISKAQAIVALVDGAEVDTGVAWELGYATALGIPTLCFRTDSRRSEYRGVNIMIEFSATKMVYFNAYKKTAPDVVDFIVEEVLEFIQAGE